MLQIVFNEISAAEMSALPKEMQLDLLAEFQFLPDELDKLDTEKFGVVEWAVEMIRDVRDEG